MRSWRTKQECEILSVLELFYVLNKDPPSDNQNIICLGSSPNSSV